MAKKAIPRKRQTPWHGHAPPVKGVVFDQGVADFIIQEMYNGKTWIAILRDPSMPSRSTVHAWERDVPEFATQVKLARVANAQLYFEEAREELDDSNMMLAGAINNQTGLPAKPYFIAMGKAGILLRMAAMRAPQDLSERRVAPQGEPTFKPDEAAQQRMIAKVNDFISKKSTSAKS